MSNVKFVITEVDNGFTITTSKDNGYTSDKTYVANSVSKLLKIISDLVITHEECKPRSGAV